ncbi:MAG: MarR family winged helix-turn-helix transcriptional regulator [Hyphomonas sp.]
MHAKKNRKTGTLPEEQVEHRELTNRLLQFFYPIHYRIGMELEEVMCQGKISRKQAAILWLIQSRVGKDGWMRRKEIEISLSTWFEISNSNVSKLLRELSKPPLGLVEHIENPDSGREKLVRLTRSGRRFVDGMTAASVDYLSEQISHVENDELAWGVDFFALSFRRSVRAARLEGKVGHMEKPPASVIGEFERSKP